MAFSDASSVAVAFNRDDLGVVDEAIDDDDGATGGSAKRDRSCTRFWSGRIGFTPKADGGWEFVRHAGPGALFAGTVLAGLGKALVSPTGLGQRGRLSFAA